MDAKLIYFVEKAKFEVCEKYKNKVLLPDFLRCVNVLITTKTSIMLSCNILLYSTIG